MGYVNTHGLTDSLISFVEQHAAGKGLSDTLKALFFIRTLYCEGNISADRFEHCLNICRMLIDLNINLSVREEDTLLAAAICHILPEENAESGMERLLFGDNKMSQEIIDVIVLLNRKKDVKHEYLDEYFSTVQQNKLALLLALTDQGNVVEELHSLKSWQVRKFIYDTRRYYFSMCIYAKENYYELMSPIGILMEKLRNLTDVSEALVTKFERMEIDLTLQMQALREENATIRGILKNLKKS